MTEAKKFPRQPAAALEPARHAQGYRGRFAPSPTGPLHAGSLVAALASWLDARSHQGKWLIRLENVDTVRERPGAASLQIEQLADFGMISDETIVVQSDREPLYVAALQRLQEQAASFYCRCTRGQLQALAQSLSRTQDATGEPADAGDAYPGSCRLLGYGPPGALRLRVPPGIVRFVDRACGPFEQDVARSVGDFVLRRSDGLWAYQLAVVVDDAAQGISDVVRGADLLDSTPRQILLQRALGLPTPRYLHVPLVRDAQGRKLSKHEGARPLGSDVLAELEQAWQHLGFARTGAGSVRDFQVFAVAQWRARYALPMREASDAPSREPT